MLSPVLLSFCLLLSMLSMGALLYQGAFLLWSGRKLRARIAGVSLLFASFFFVLHALALLNVASGDLEYIAELMGAGLYLAALVANLFFLNVLLSENSSAPRFYFSWTSPALGFLCFLGLIAFLVVDGFLFPGLALSGLIRAELNVSLLLFGFCVVLPVLLSGGLLLQETGRGSLGGRRLLKASAILLALLIVTLVSGSLARILGWPMEVIHGLVLDAISQSFILAGIVLASQASVRYEVFSGNLPRLGMPGFYWKNLRSILLVSLITVIVYQYRVSSAAESENPGTLQIETLLWLLLPVFAVSVQCGYMEYRMMRDRERVLTRMQPFDTAGILGHPPFLHGHPSEAFKKVRGILDRVCEEFGLEAAAILPEGSFAALLGPAAITSSRGDQLFESGKWDSPSTEQNEDKGGEPKAEMRTGERPFEDGIHRPPDSAKKEEIAGHWRLELRGSEGLHGEMHLLGQRLTREEREFIRVSAERLLDSMALLQFSRILMDLQKEYMHSRKLEETMARRVLHDEILPEIHAMILEQASRSSKPESDDSRRSDSPTEERTGRERIGNPDDLVPGLQSIHRRISALLREMPGYDNSLLKGGLVASIFRIANGYGLETELRIEEPELTAGEKEIAFYAIREGLRNASRYGKGRVRMKQGSSSYRLDWTMEQKTRKSKAKAHPGIGAESAEDMGGIYTADRGSGQGLSIHSALLLLSGGGLEFKEGEESSVLRIYIK